MMSIQAYEHFPRQLRAAPGLRPYPVNSAGAKARLLILAMIADTMLPEAFEGAHNFSGLITAAGFLCAFALSIMGP